MELQESQESSRSFIAQSQFGNKNEFVLILNTRNIKQVCKLGMKQWVGVTSPQKA